jgi:hypothetical protein
MEAHSCLMNFKIPFFNRCKKDSPLSASPLAPDWTPEHAQWLRQMLIHPCGQDLLARARAMQCNLAVKSCKGEFEPARAAGIGDAIDWLESLTRFPQATGEQVATPKPSPRERGNFAPELATQT